MEDTPIDVSRGGEAAQGRKDVSHLAVDVNATDATSNTAKSSEVLHPKDEPALTERTISELSVTSLQRSITATSDSSSPVPSHIRPNDADHSSECSFTATTHYDGDVARRVSNSSPSTTVQETGQQNQLYYAVSKTKGVVGLALTAGQTISKPTLVISSKEQQALEEAQKLLEKLEERAAWAPHEMRFYVMEKHELQEQLTRLPKTPATLDLLTQIEKKLEVVNANIEVLSPTHQRSPMEHVFTFRQLDRQSSKLSASDAEKIQIQMEKVKKTLENRIESYLNKLGLTLDNEPSEMRSERLRELATSQTEQTRGSLRVALRNLAGTKLPGDLNDRLGNRLASLREQTRQEATDRSIKHWKEHLTPDDMVKNFSRYKKDLLELRDHLQRPGTEETFSQVLILPDLQDLAYPDLKINLERWKRALQQTGTDDTGDRTRQDARDYLFFARDDLLKRLDDPGFKALYDEVQRLVYGPIKEKVQQECVYWIEKITRANATGLQQCIPSAQNFIEQNQALLKEIVSVYPELDTKLDQLRTLIYPPRSKAA